MNPADAELFRQEMRKTIHQIFSERDKKISTISSYLATWQQMVKILNEELSLSVNED